MASRNSFDAGADAGQAQAFVTPAAPAPGTSSLYEEAKAAAAALVQHQAAARAGLPPLPPQAAGSKPAPGGGKGFKKTFYKRKLPSPPAIEFSSPEGRQLFAEALSKGHMTGFFKLMEQFSTQDEPAFCGLASLAMVLNALSIDPRRTWKGAWRWFHEAMLDCCRPLEAVKEEGITLAQAACLARCNGARVELQPFGAVSLERFREEIMQVCASGEEHIVVSYSRKVFLQTGDGHFSPVGGYHAGRDLVLILDVARFKYPPHWVPLEQLYKGMAFLDPETQRPRGYMRMASHPLLDSVLFTLDVRSRGWRPALEYVQQEAIQRAQAMAAEGSVASGEEVVRRLLAEVPLEALQSFMVVRSGQQAAVASGPHVCAPLPTGGQPATSGMSFACGQLDGVSAELAAAAATADRCVPLAQRQQLLDELHATPLYQLVSSVLAERGQVVTCTVCAEGAAAASAQAAAMAVAQLQQALPADSQASAAVAADASAALASAVDAAPDGDGAAADPLLLAERATLMLLMQPAYAWPTAEQWKNAEVHSQLMQLLDTSIFNIVEAEAAYLREQLAHIDQVLERQEQYPSCKEHSHLLDCAAHGH